MYNYEWDGESNERVYEIFGMEEKGFGIYCRVVEWIKRNTLRWFMLMERMPET